MRRRTICIFLALLFVFSFFLLSRNREPIEAFATNIMSRQGFLAMTPYGVAEAHDTDTTLRKAPAIYWGYDSDGSVTFSAGTYQNAYNSSCEPRVMAIPQSYDDTAANLYCAYITSCTYTGFTYEVRKGASGTNTDVTATVPVFWVSFGWR